MTRKSMGRATVAGLSIAAVAALGLGSTPIAFAQDGSEQCVKDFDAKKKAKLTVNKRDGAEGSDRDNGLTNSNPGGTPLNGVTFKVTKVEGLDVTTNEGQQKIAKLAETYKNNPKGILKESGLSAGAEATKKTEDQGTAAFDNLDPGMYILEETDAPEGYVKSAPVLVALPLTNPTEKNCWNYDVQVYPKNSKTKVTKEVVDATTPGSGNQTEDPAEQGGTNDNSRVTYKVGASVPQKKLERFRIVDPIDVRAHYVEGSAKVTLSNETALVENTDYKIVYKEIEPAPEKPAPGDENVKPGAYLTVEFLKDGLTKLAEQAAGNADLSVNLEFNVDIDPTEGKTVIPNQAQFYPAPPNEGEPDFNPENPGDVPPPPGIPTPKVETYYGKLKFNKVATDGTKLKDAKFQVFQCNAKKELQGTPVTVGDKKDFVSADATGEVLIDGLLVNDFRNNSEFVNGKDGAKWVDSSFYCLKEIEAPEGYELLPAPIQFQVLKDGSVKFEKDGELVANATDIEVKNAPKDNGFNLPLTGGAGIAPMVVVGGLLIAGSGAYVAAASRRKKQS